MNEPKPHAVTPLDSREPSLAPLRWFAVLLFLAFSLLDLCIFSVFKDPQKLIMGLPEWLPMRLLISLVRGVVLGQAALLCIPMVSSRVHLVIRSVGSGLCLWGLAQLGHYPRTDTLIRTFMGELIFYFLLLLVFCYLARVAGLQIATFQGVTGDGNRNGGKASKEAPSNRSMWQFSVTGVLCLTSAIAIAIACLKTDEYFYGRIAWRIWPGYLMLAVSGMTVLALVLFSWQRVGSAMRALALAAILIVASSLGFAIWQHSIGFLRANLANCVIVGVAAVVLRVGGLRLAPSAQWFQENSLPLIKTQ